MMPFRVVPGVESGRAAFATVLFLAFRLLLPFGIRVMGYSIEVMPINLSLGPLVGGLTFQRHG